MSLSHCSHKLNGLARELRVAWDHTREAWRDANAEYVERQCIEPWLQQYRRASKSAAQMAELARQARRDCE